MNAVVRSDTHMEPQQIISRLHEVEARFGRERTRRWGPRSLDLDLLAVDSQVHPDPETQSVWRCLPPERQMREVPGELILPHPRLAERAFVLVPWAEIAPGWRHPLTGRTVADMLAALDPVDLEGIRPVSKDTARE